MQPGEVHFPRAAAGDMSRRAAAGLSMNIHRLFTQIAVISIQIKQNNNYVSYCKIKNAVLSMLCRL